MLSKFQESVERIYCTWDALIASGLRSTDSQTNVLLIEPAAILPNMGFFFNSKLKQMKCTKEGFADILIFNLYKRETETPEAC